MKIWTRIKEAIAQWIAPEGRYQSPDTSEGASGAVLIGHPLLTATFSVFLSSGDDAMELRNRIERILSEVFNPQLSYAEIPVRIEVRRWERRAAQRAMPGRRTNELFVEEARESNWVIAILHDHLGPGTREEITEVAKISPPDLKVLWVSASNDTPVASFLAGHSNSILYTRIHNPDSESGWIKLLQNLTAILLRAVQGKGEGAYYERR